MSNVLANNVTRDPAFADLKDVVKAEINLWLKGFESLADIRHGELGPRLNELANQMDCSAVTARRKYDAFMAHGWKGLINQSKISGKKRTKLPPAFIDWVKYMFESNQRNSMAAYKYIINIWENTDEPIPGYAIQPSRGIHDHPDGWSYANLSKHMPTPYESSVARIGRTAAAEFRPLVLMTRAELEVGEMIQYDDMQFNVKVNSVGINQKAQRPLELSALDLCSGCKFAWGVKAIQLDDEGVRQMLKKRDMRFLLAYQFTRIGYRQKGTTCIVENATAAIDKPLEELLFKLSDGAIRVQRSSIKNASALHGWYKSGGKGNPRMKGSLESLHSFAQSIMAMLPGQMGKDRDHSPEELHGREVANDALIEVLEHIKLPPEKIELLRFGFMHISKFVDILDYIYKMMNARHDHDLEGWEAAGFITEEYRLSLEDKRWLPIQTLFQRHDAQALQQHIQQPGLMRCRKMSPIEVWESGRKKLTKLPVFAVPQILGPELAEIRRVSDRGTFEFRDNEIHPEKQVYLARATNERGLEIILKDGDKFQTFVNPFDPQVMFVSSEKGEFIGICKRIDRVPRNNHEELIRTIGARAYDEKVRLAEFRARHQGDVDQKIADQEWNAKVISGVPVLPDEIAAHERMMTEEGALADVVVPAAVSREVLADQAADDQAAAADELDKMFKR